MRFISSIFALIFLITAPVNAYALEGYGGARVTIAGIVQSIDQTATQAFNGDAAAVIIKARNGQLVTVNVTLDTAIIPQGGSRRRSLTPSDLAAFGVGRQVRVTGNRLSDSSMTSSLFIVLNIEKDTQLTNNGTIIAVNQDGITVMLVNGETKTLTVTNDTEVNINYQLFGMSSLTLVGKSVFYTLNPLDFTQAKILRITRPPNKNTVYSVPDISN